MITEKSKHIAIIGAGPAGLMAAEIIATAGHKVTVYDQMPSPGRKLLMAGRGGLNLTHSEPLPAFTARYGEEAGWLAPALETFPPDAVRAWCEGLGQETFIGSSGRVFPRALKAAPLLRAWLRRLEGLGVRFATRHRFKGWEGAALLFGDATGKTLSVQADATVLALGGASWPRLGSDGGWVDMLREKGIEIAPLRPANSGFLVPWSDYFRAKFAGSPLKPVTLSYHGISRRGEAMITAQGLEGGVVYALSATLRDALTEKGSLFLHLDLRPGMDENALARKLGVPRASQSLSTYLRKCGLSPLLIALLRETTSAGQLAQATPAFLAARLKALPLTLTGSTGLERAISTAGGLRREELTEHFMLKKMPGVFAAGEMLDWEAPTGGYLLQGCFSTAVAAAKGVLHFLGNSTP